MALQFDLSKLKNRIPSISIDPENVQILQNRNELYQKFFNQFTKIYETQSFNFLNSYPSIQGVSMPISVHLVRVGCAPEYPIEIPSFIPYESSPKSS